MNLNTRNYYKLFKNLYYNYFATKNSKLEIFNKYKNFNLNSNFSKVDIELCMAFISPAKLRRKKEILFNMRNLNIYDRLELILKEMATPYLDIDEISKIKYAEVFTPIWLIDEQLDNCFNLSDFSNPKLKWLDPANGIGNYTLRVIQRLLNGLKDVPGLEDESVRYKHIIENMIYVCEIQPMNMFAYIYTLSIQICNIKLTIIRVLILKMISNYMLKLIGNYRGLIE